MQPASSGSSGSSGSSALRRWGPIAAILAAIALGVGVLVVTSGDDDDGDSSDTTLPSDTSPGDTTDGTTGDTTEGTTADTSSGGEITYPLSFSEAQEQGIEVDWGERCDTERGTVAVPDFFAPECYAPFEGDNGGETAPGVTADTIKIVMYQEQPDDLVIKYITSAIAVDDTNQEQYETMQTMVDYFETYYETYGRTVELVLVEGSGDALDSVAARADAIRIATEIKPFMVWGGPALTNAFGEELAARGVPCISCVPSQPSDWYAANDPYVWAIDGSAPQKQDHVLEFISKQLVGGNAEHAGDPGFQSQPRQFGLVYVESSTASTDLANRFATGMEEAGAPFAEMIPYVLEPTTIQQTATQVIAKLKDADVTTVVLATDPVAPGEFTREATRQGYFPEWLIAAATLTDTTAFARTYDPEQWAHAFGVTSLAARTAPESGGYYYLHTWFAGEEPPAADTIAVNTPPAALFFAVLQGVGPNLTAQTWRDALWEGSDTQQAISQPYLSWGDHGYWPDADYHGIDDATLIWWDADATGPDEIRKDGTGMYRYVDGGTRYLPGEWTTEEKLFDPEGAVAIYTERPPGEQPPDYASPAG